MPLRHLSAAGRLTVTVTVTLTLSADPNPNPNPVDCESVADAMMVFAEGLRNRKVGPHLLNKGES